MTDQVDIPNACTPFEGILTGGQPSWAALREAKDAGYKAIINLRDPGEFADWDEAETVETLGMRYVSIPIPDASALTRENAEALDKALKEAEPGPVMVHCGSGARVGALFALRAAAVEDKDTDAALDVGRRAGLRGMEGAIRQRLEEL
jgi:uncharacterized protein (TIGR01244 family)